jgi:uncharacterized membrane protein YadS
LTSSALEPLSTRWLAGRSLLSGLFLTATAALSPLIIAIVLGLAFHNTVGTPASFKRGVVFAVRRVLRFAIILLGLQLSLSQVVEAGAAGLGIIAFTSAAPSGSAASGHRSKPAVNL